MKMLIKEKSLHRYQYHAKVKGASTCCSGFLVSVERGKGGECVPALGVGDGGVGEVTRPDNGGSVLGLEKRAAV